MAAPISMRELLEAGVHFGHQTRRWNPKMRRFIFAERAGIYIIDLQQTIVLVEQAHHFVHNLAERGGTVLFVGTKKQTREAIEGEASRVGMPFVSHRWLGGLLTNYRTMQARIEHLHELRRLRDENQLELLPSKERIRILRELEKLETNLGGVAMMRKLPDAVVVVDMNKEALAVREARRCGIPVIGLVDTNCDPDDADYVIPGNDDAIKSCAAIMGCLANGIDAGRNLFRKAEEELAAKARAEAEARAAEEAAAAAAAEAAAAEQAGESAAPAPAPAPRAAAPAAAARVAPAPAPAVEAPAPAPALEPVAPEPVAEAPAPEPVAPEPVAEEPAPEPVAPEPAADAPEPEPEAAAAPAEA